MGREDHHLVVKAFLDQGLDVNIRGVAQWTALMVAAHRGQFTSLKLLLDAGADPDLMERFTILNPDLKSLFGSALMFAAAGNYPDIVSELLNY